MIVVAIIGLLAAVAIPNLNKARKTSMKTACHNSLRNINGVKTGVFAIEKRKDGDYAVTWSDLEPYLDGNRDCPAGGEYSLGTVNEETSCNIHGVDLGEGNGNKPIIKIVKTGQTGSDIAKEHGVTREALEES